MFSQHPKDHQWRQKVDLIRAHYIHILSSVIDIIKQQSKAERIGNGDDCTRYFFAKIKQRNTTTYIHSIQDDQGQTRQGFKEVKEVMHQYYKGFLENHLTERQQIYPNVIAKGNTLTVEQQMSLCTPFIDEEIKSMMFSIPNTKSLGPDGFSSGFFKTTWHITGELVRGFIKHFFQTGQMLSLIHI